MNAQINKIGEKLYLLNKKAKSYGREMIYSDYQLHDVIKQKYLYGIKDKIIKSLGERTDVIHSFGNNGYGRLYKLGNETFHDYFGAGKIDLEIAESLLEKNKNVINQLANEVGIKVSPSIKDDGIGEYKPRIRLNLDFDYQKEVFSKLRKKYGDYDKKYTWTEIAKLEKEFSGGYDKLKNLEKSLNDEVSNSAEIIKNQSESVKPPRENAKGTKFEESDLKYLENIANSLKTKSQLTDIWNKAHNK